MRALLAFFLLAAGPLAADPPILDLPIDCTLGQTCFVEDYVDHDPAKGRKRDHACGINTRDGHRGTDFALLSFDAIKTGVAVRAAASGRVAATRDEMPDDRLMRGVTSKTACGNAVLIDHGDGWQSLYCHMRLGSVAVRSGDHVKSGDPLGLVGLSGQTNHPHLHMTLTHNKQVVDPFHPARTEVCGPDGETLWASPPAYFDTALMNAGFSNAVPSYADLRGGTARQDRIPSHLPLVVYAEAGHARHGDKVTISATGPSGDIFRHTRALKNPKKSQLPAFGKKPPPGGWPVGEYLGEVLLTRDGVVVAHRFAHVHVTPE